MLLGFCHLYMPIYRMVSKVCDRTARLAIMAALEIADELFERDRQNGKVETRSES